MKVLKVFLAVILSFLLLCAQGALMGVIACNEAISSDSIAKAVQETDFTNQISQQALDAASNILYLSISLLQDGESIVSGFFADDPDGYRSLYKQSNVDHVIQWLQFFCGQLCELFQSRRKDYKNHIVTNVRKYINEHVSERLSLNEVAAVFGISPNYLSQLFSKYNDTGFSEYINICKITEAKRLLEEENMKVYEAAEALGFESAFYFSKVFKRVEGVSPTEYVNNKFS